MIIETTESQFEIFKSECEKWVEFFGLKNWHIHYDHSEIEDSRAQAAFDCVGGIATVTLNTEWDERSEDFVNDHTVKRTAFHEICELLLGPINDMVGQRFGVDEGDVVEEIHRLIRILENTVFENAK